METVIVILLIAIAIGAGYVIVKANPSILMKSGSTRPGRPAGNALRIENVGSGGVFSLRGFGPDMSDIDVRVVARHTYSENGWEWFELEGESDIGTVWVTVEEDDETEVSICLRRFGLADLGLTKDQLDTIDDQERGGFTFEGGEYVYEESGAAAFHRNGDRTRAERFRYWEFESRDGKSLISVERWSDGSTEVHLSQAIWPSQITVYANEGAAA